MRSADYSKNDTNQDLMELLEWLDYKYEAYLKQVDLLKYKKMSLSSENEKRTVGSELESYKLLLNDHKGVIDSLKYKMTVLDKAIVLMEKLEAEDTNKRHKVEEILEDVQFNIQKMSSNQIVAEFN